MLACGNCVYYSLYLKFPPIASLVVIFPLWLVGLSAIRTLMRARLLGVPSLYLTVPLVLLVWLFSPATYGPPLGFWIPICCVVGTISGLSSQQSAAVKRGVLLLLVCAVISSAAFGTLNVLQYYQMSEQERDQLNPETHRH